MIDEKLLKKQQEASEALKQEQKNFQECAHLDVPDEYKNSSTHLQDLFDIQSSTQRDVYGYDFDSMSLRDLMDFWHMNSHAMISEIHEATDALGGIKDGIGSGVWKKWKQAYEKAKDMSLGSLSVTDKKELKMEIIDMLHFWLNYAISIGMTAEETYNMYIAKNVENKQRQLRGY